VQFQSLETIPMPAISKTAYSLIFVKFSAVLSLRNC